ncbi:MAG TPA: hypothetical protein VHF24_01370 [Acidimicrobiales bacterium]|jgi:hypothetical protein|nr:hypothetical protein [Acidimicrobiales bacterium]
MGAATIGTLVGVTIIVAALAAYLITISYVLYRVSFRLGTVLIGVRAIVAQTDAVPKYVGIILNDVMAIDQAAHQLLSWGKTPEDISKVSRMRAMAP